jgi:capsular polysaccharide biosynthesis protein
MPRTKKENVLPSNLSQNPIWPLAHTILPRLIERKQTQAKRCWQEPIFDRNFAGRNRSLQRRNVAEDEDDNDGEDHAGEEEIVL